ncbi:MAG: DUF4184 family protein [Gammaproteobacteria bacterium]
MPWTVSHVAAILPFRRWCPARLSFVALVIGSMSPDFAYYLGQSEIADFAHSLPGLFVVALPGALLVIAAAWLLRDLLGVPLPQPHRIALQQAFASLSRDLNWRRGIALAASILLGAATHAAWDSFTHATGLPVERSELLQRELLRIGSWNVETYSYLQHASTLFGIVVLAVVYRSRLKFGSAAAVASSPDAGDVARWRVLGAIATMGAGTCIAWITAGIMQGGEDVPSLVVQGVFVGSDLIAILYLAAALAWRRLRSGGGDGHGLR